MTRSSCFKVGLAVAITALAGILKAAAQIPALSLQPSQLPRLGTIDERFQSYNVEMVEVTGGNFWKPYRANASAPSGPGAAGAVDPHPSRNRPPLDFAKPPPRRCGSAPVPAHLAGR